VRFVKQAALALLIVFSAAAAVGLTAPAGGAFSISVHATFLRVDPSAGGPPHPRALGLDVDVKCGSMHAHLGWPGFLLAAVSTPHADRSL
jgi:hypothetical protein